MLRLERLLANRGYCARSDAAGFLRRHTVLAGGKRLTRPDERVSEAAVTIDGQPIDPPTLLLMMHKPVGLTCSHAAEESGGGGKGGPEGGGRSGGGGGGGGGVVYDLLPERYRRRDPVVATVGRLDKDTSGLLLLTDNGPLLHRLTSPRHHVPRVYLATLDRDLAGTEAARFASGTLLLEGDDKPLLPAGLEPLGARLARVTLHEGRYHQVRRMFAAVGNHVVALHRERFGPLCLGDLPVSAVRPLSAEEANALTARA